MAGAVVDLAGNILARKTILSKEAGTDSVERLIGLIRNLKESISQEQGAFKGIGLGVPGVTDPLGQSVHLAPGIGWENFDIGEVLTKEFSVPFLWITMQIALPGVSFGGVSWKVCKTELQLQSVQVSA